MGTGRRFWVATAVIGMLAALTVAPAGAGQEAARDGHLGPCTIVGTSGDDVLVGTEGDDVICGRAGNDRIFGNGGDDVLRGGDGDDIIRGGFGYDVIRGNDGDDKLFGGAQGDDILGGPGDDILRGKYGDDNLEGNKGNDRIFGARGDDTLNGGQDIDACDGGQGTDTLTACEVRGQVTDLQLLGINDYHGHVLDEAAGTVAGEDAGGGEYLAAKLNYLRQDAKNSLTVAAGDLIGGSPAFSGLFHDEPSVESLNAMHVDVSSVGNHEFDEGVTELLRMQNGGCHPIDGCYFPGEEYPGADWQWLAANVQNDAGDTPLPGYWVTEVDGVHVGFIGMTLEATNVLVSAEGIEGWNFLDEVETANALVPTLQAEGVEAIVVLLHEGGAQTPAPGDVNACVDLTGPILAINDGLDPAIDVMITGHTHLPYNCMLMDSAGHPRIVTSAYSFGRVVSEVNLVLEKRSGDVNRYLSNATNHAVFRADLVPDATQTAIIERWRPLFEAAGNTPVGTITADINRGGVEGSDRGVESPAGNLVADAQLWSTSPAGAQIAFMNPGGVRSDLLFASSAEGEGDGVVTFGEAFTFQPFGNTLLTFPMTGAEIVSVLEEQCQPAGSSRPFLHLGVSEGFSYDLATSFDGVTGDCLSATITNMMLNGSPVDMATTYMVTVNSFLSTGGDNFTTFADVNAADGLDGGIDLNALTNYLGTFSPVAPPSTDRVNELP